MRRGPEVSGWVGSLFPEPIDQVKVPSDRCICHQDCPQYETCETEALDKSSKVYYLLRCVKGKFPACANCMCMACDRYHECEDGPERGQPGGTRYRMCNRPISITGCPDYSGPISWMSEAACKKCDHVCDLRKELIWAPRVRCDLNPIEPTKKPTEELYPVQLDGKWHDISIIDNVVKVDGVICDDNFVPLTPPAETPAPVVFHRGDRVKFRDSLAPGGIGFGYVTGIERHGGVCGLSIHVTWAEYGKEFAMAKDRSFQLMSPDQLELAPLDEWMLANCGKHHTCRDDCAGLRSGALCPWVIGLDFLKDCVRQGDMPADLLDDRAKDDAEAKAAKPARAKKTKCLGTPDESIACKECATNKFWKWRPCAALQNVEVPAKEPIALLLNGKWYSEGKMLWDCSDCLCLDCANEGKSCHDCKGFEHCMKHGGKMGGCPDFRAPDGKEQHCLENGRLCFKCQLIGEHCEECPGPIRCDKPRMKCKDYVGAEVEA